MFIQIIKSSYFQIVKSKITLFKDTEGVVIHGNMLNERFIGHGQPLILDNFYLVELITTYRQNSNEQWFHMFSLFDRYVCNNLIKVFQLPDYFSDLVWHYNLFLGEYFLIQ